MGLFRKIPELSGCCQIPALPACRDREMFVNPDRGLRHEICFKLEDIFPYQIPETLRSFRELVQRHVDFYEFVHPTLAQTYVYLTDYHEREELPESVFIRLRGIFQILREFGLRALLRFAYQWKDDGSDEADGAIMCAHMDQLFPVVAENLDVVHVYQAGFLGLWGEWHGYTKPVDPAVIMTHIAETCPQPLFVQTRIPSQKNLVSDDNPAKARLSYHNDSIFGEKHPASGNVDPGTPDTEQIRRECHQYPIDGELFWGAYCANNEHGYFPDPFRVLDWLYDQRFTSLSVVHNYFENGYGSPYAMARWRSIPLTIPMLLDRGIHADPDYFAEERDVFECLRDHLGYRLKAQKIHVSQEQNALEVTLHVVNYGFAAPHMLQDTGFVLLDMDGNVAADAKCGSISSWQSRPVDNTTREPQLHKAEGKLTAVPGAYYLGFYARNRAGDPARLANDLVFEHGYNIFGAVNIV